MACRICNDLRKLDLGHVNICNDQNKLTLIYAEIYSGLRKLEIRHVKIRNDQNRLTLAYAEIYSDQSKLTTGHAEICSDQNNVILPFRGARTTIQRVLRWFKPLKCAIFTQKGRQLKSAGDDARGLVLRKFETRHLVSCSCLPQTWHLKPAT